MTLLVGVLDANMVIRLAQGQVFHLLPRIYDRLLIPTSVTQQVVTGAGRDGEAELLQALGYGWLRSLRTLIRWNGFRFPDPGLIEKFWRLRWSTPLRPTSRSSS